MLETNRKVTIDLDVLIQRYTEAATRVVRGMHEALGESNLLAAWRDGRLPATGDLALPGLGTGSYRFHGRGCYVEVGTTNIDIELCQDEKMLGFDAWRLLRFAEETLGLQGLELEDIDSELAKKKADGALGYSNNAPYFGLYFVPTAPAS